MLKLQQHHFTAQYKKGKEMYKADSLPQASLPRPTEAEAQDVFCTELAMMDFTPATIRADTFLRLQRETKKHATLQFRHQVVMTTNLTYLEILCHNEITETKYRRTIAL